MKKKVVLISAIIILVICGITIKNALEANKYITKAYEGGKYNKEKKVNTPKLATGMTAIKWENNEIIKIDNPSEDNTWYDYLNGQWANAMTEDGSMWVWIPRYAYNFESGYHSNELGKIDIKFLIGTTNKVGEGKTPKYKIESGQGNWLIHPSFTNANSELGIGWDADIEGFWVAKFEAGRGDIASKLIYGGKGTRTNIEINKSGEKITYPTFKPNEISFNYMNSNDMYLLSKELVAVGNPYGLNKLDIESMQITNTQWGAVAYLTNSIYGLNGEKIEVNNINLKDVSDLITAKSGGEDYKVNIAQSSTRTIYGVYDLAGGAWERVAALVDTREGMVRTYYLDLYKDKDTKYVDKYIIEEKDDKIYNYDANKNKYGDAMWETSSNAEGNNAWNNETSIMPSNVAALIRRGGGVEGEEKAGIFAFFVTAGCETNANSSFRVVLINK